MLDLHIKFHYFEFLKRLTLATEKNGSKILAVTSPNYTKVAMKVKEVDNGLNAIKEPLLSNDIGKKSQETKTNKLAKTTEVLVKKAKFKNNYNKTCK